MTYGSRTISNGPSQDNTAIAHAVDTIGGIDYAAAKLIDPTEGSTTPIGVAANPMHVQGTVTATVSTILPTTPTYAQVSVGDATATNALAASPTRKKAFLINNTSETFWIKEDADAEQGKYFSIGPGQFYTVLSTKRVSVIKSSGGALNIDTVDVT